MCLYIPTVADKGTIHEAREHCREWNITHARMIHLETNIGLVKIISPRMHSERLIVSRELLFMDLTCSIYPTKNCDMLMLVWIRPPHVRHYTPDWSRWKVFYRGSSTHWIAILRTCVHGTFSVDGYIRIMSHARWTTRFCTSSDAFWLSVSSNT